MLSASLLFSPWLWAAAPTASAQEEDGTAVARLLASMSTAERVGQLFLVTFRGDTAVRGSDIADLIANYRVGGIVLLAENDNITGYGEAANVPIQVADLANQ
ncbi:MAG: hypothetical protein IAE79_05550, partial [Anaerolinea sp.]|nr:hypothetical protein [Anaerolinea sp.]